MSGMPWLCTSRIITLTLLVLLLCVIMPCQGQTDSSDINGSTDGNATMMDAGTELNETMTNDTDASAGSPLPDTSATSGQQATTQAADTPTQPAADTPTQPAAVPTCPPGGGEDDGNMATAQPDCPEQQPTWIILGISCGGAFIIGGLLSGCCVYCCSTRPLKHKLGCMYLDKGGGSSFLNPVAVDDHHKPMAAPRHHRANSGDGNGSAASARLSQHQPAQQRHSRLSESSDFGGGGGNPTPFPRGEVRSAYPRLNGNESEDVFVESRQAPRKFSKQLVEERREHRNTVLSLREM
ncbi:uncharacterized protein LOC135819545 isoform X2 [Sycon ciliatum]|uniref:uncharacterized protein LOC135819545 isoform X2 n=1 Tax=Sycon ciliatum TaxID=27933 RepID=UPI0031F6B610